MILRARRLSAVFIVAMAAFLAAGTAFAQQPGSTVAKLSGVQGNVLVSRGDAMIGGGNEERLAVGARVVTTAGARAIISYDAGCVITLNENQRFTVATGTCAALLASVETLGPAAGAIGGGTAGATAGTAGTVTAFGVGGGTLTALAITGGIVALGTIGIYNESRKDNVSPN